MKENQRVRITKMMLKSSLVDLMKTKSIFKISIKEICEKAEMNRSTFYKYYNTEFDLLKDIENEYLLTIETYISQINNENVLTKLLEYVIDNIEVFKLFLNEIPENSFFEKLIEMCLENMAYQKVIIKDERKNSNEYLYKFIIFGSLSVVKNWISKENRELPSEMNDIMMNILGKFLRQ
ncbi:MAG: TetR/AcrR family transcriptional regulator C-terminal domain-containing protein [Firmicutes bacterium]|nr:TetR/AcrR family transcriptional regulator C-terminal domain-containing protein [Bacillota bacterium]